MKFEKIGRTGVLSKKKRQDETLAKKKKSQDDNLCKKSQDKL